MPTKIDQLTKCANGSITKHNDSYIIVGAGVFGTSVARHLIQKYPSGKVMLIDRGLFPYEAGASWDCNKAVRADYTNLLYMRLALEALEYWTSDPLYSLSFHRSGIVWLDNHGLQQMAENYAALNSSTNYRGLSPGDVKSRWRGIHSDADYENVTEIFVNEDSGWVEATRALSNHIILATGAYTPILLVKTALRRVGLHAEDRLVAAGIVSAVENLSEVSDRPLFKPFANTLTPSGGSIPDNKRRPKLTEYYCPEGTNVSVLPRGEYYSQWDLEATMNGIFGNKSAGWELTEYRIWWDAITPTQDPTICEHPYSKNLYIATGGSFHNWKFFPIIGQWFADMLKGTQDPNLAAVVSWDRSYKGSAHEGLLPRREMRDV
ncbi:hypothetical protein BX600DRAFT_482998 [Xylariales sp. PMI_506]|nr:hypothetical protein BX600DRAFT_482998 [Xylariales sp. PMI_506]